MWHASVCGNRLPEYLMQIGFKALSGVGVRTQVWADRGADVGSFPTVHIRRKTSPQEERKIGPVIDIRGTERHMDIVREMSRLTSFDEDRLLRMG